MAFLISVTMLMASLVALTDGAVTSVSTSDKEATSLASSAGMVPLSGWNFAEQDAPAGTSYFIWEEDLFGSLRGGWWSDVEKIPSDDGPGNPDPNNEGEEDDQLCWAFTASNMLEYSGWGFVNGMDTSDEFGDYFEDHVTDDGHTIEGALSLWFTGLLPSIPDVYSEEDVEGGEFWSAGDLALSLSTYVIPGLAMQQIEQNLRSGFATGISLRDYAGANGHCITVWGINVDETKPTWDIARYKGIWVSDSDSHKDVLGAEDWLTYYSVQHEDVGGVGFWNMTSYGMRIWAVTGLGPFPFEDRPMADIMIDQSGYDEGSEFVFNSSRSYDPVTLLDPAEDGLLYRWDFNGDGVWDTEWSSEDKISHTYNDNFEGKVYVQVFDGRLTDIARVDIEVHNVAPTIEMAFDHTIHESDVLEVEMSITDPGIDDTFTVLINWGDDSYDIFLVEEGVRTRTFSHAYAENIMTTVVWAQIFDKDGGHGSCGGSLIVYNTAPTVSSTGDKIDENAIATVSGTITDPGVEDAFTLVIDWGDGHTSTFSYPAGTTFFSEEHQYLDDDPTGTSWDDYEVSLVIQDDDGGTSSTSTKVTVYNVNPTMTPEGDDINETGIATVSGTITDPGVEDAFTLVIDWGDGHTSTFSYPAGTTFFSEEHQYLDDDPTGTSWDDYEVSLVIQDDDGERSSFSATVTVYNVDPITIMGDIDQPNAEFILPEIHTLNFSGSFIDLGTQDTHTAIWDWGDGTSDSGAVIESGGSGAVTGFHVYMAPGTYTVILTVTDDDMAYSISTLEVVVVDAEDTLDMVNDYIQNLSDGSFANKADKKKVALSNMIDAILDMVNDGDINGAIEDIQNNLLKKVDGFMGGNPRDDWICDPQAQEELTQMLNDICELLALSL